MMLGNIFWLLLIGVVIYMMMKGGGGCCGGHDHGGHDGSGDEAPGHAHHHREIEAGGDTADTDPVCGMKVSDTAIASTHLGRTFHFCSEQCRKVFNLNPGKYAGA